MDFRDVSRLAFTEYLDGLKKAVDGLTPVELSWQPNPNANPILWIVWHMARVEDRWMNSYVGQGIGEVFEAGNPPEVWIHGRWCERFRLPAEGTGARWTAEQVAQFPPVPIADVLGYFEAVREQSFKVLDRLTPADLEKAFGEGDRARKVAWVLGHVAIEEGQHLGQVAYLRGMLRGINR